MLLKIHIYGEEIQGQIYLIELVPPFLYAGHTSLLHELSANAVIIASISITTNFFILFSLFFFTKIT